MPGMTDKKLALLFLLGWPFSPLYSLLMALRSNFYRRGIFKRQRLEVPVISVGNLLMGGTGKTPLVRYIAEFLRARNRKPAVLSRGYKGTASSGVNIVSDGTDILLDAAAAGDEPRLLAEKLANIPVITGKNRFAAGRCAIDSYGADTLILDDGFQHMALKRDLDLVLFSARKRMGNGRVIPGGELREPLSALERADGFVITDIDINLDREVQPFISLLESMFPEKPVFTCGYRPENYLFRMYKGKNDTIQQADASRIELYGFCGIARPESFRNTLATSNMRLTGFQPFADHHIYTEETIRSLIDNARNSGARGLITTEKDMVKLHGIFPDDFMLLVQPIKLYPDRNFNDFLLKRLGRH